MNELLNKKEQKKEYLKQWRLDNKEHIKQYGLDNKEHNKQYRLDNKKQKEEYDKQYRLDNKEHIKQWRSDNIEYIKQYYLDNKKKIKERVQQYRLDNKEYLKQYRKERRKNDPNFKLKSNLRTRMWAVLKGISKSASTMKLIGCTIEELWTHLEKSFYDCRITGEEMTRFNHGKWHVDHIIPCASFDLTDPEQQRICFNWKNLQPLWALDNMSKGSTYEIH